MSPQMIGYVKCFDDNKTTNLGIAFNVFFLKNRSYNYC